MQRHRLPLIARFAFLCACIALPVSCERPSEPLKKLFQLPPFTLTERSGKQFSAPDAMRGNVWVADFFFASCPGVCLELGKGMSSLHEATHDMPGVRFLSISTDQNDTPEVLRRYAAQHGAGERWSFLTGPKDEVFNLSIHGFKLAAADAPGVDVAEKFIHSSKLVLIDKAGWIRGYYDGIGEKQADDAKRLIADIKRLLSEP